MTSYGGATTVARPPFRRERSKRRGVSGAISAMSVRGLGFLMLEGATTDVASMVLAIPMDAAHHFIGDPGCLRERRRAGADGEDAPAASHHLSRVIAGGPGVEHECTGRQRYVEALDEVTLAGRTRVASSRHHDRQGGAPCTCLRHSREISTRGGLEE